MTKFTSYLGQHCPEDMAPGEQLRLIALIADRDSEHRPGQTDWVQAAFDGSADLSYADRLRLLSLLAGCLYPGSAMPDGLIMGGG